MSDEFEKWYASLDVAVPEIEEAFQAGRAVSDAKLIEAIKIMKESLEFYTDSFSWHSGESGEDDMTIIDCDSIDKRTKFMNEYRNYDYKRGGKKAAEALEKVKELGL